MKPRGSSWRTAWQRIERYESASQRLGIGRSRGRSAKLRLRPTNWPPDAIAGLCTEFPSASRTLSTWPAADPSGSAITDPRAAPSATPRSWPRLRRQEPSCWARRSPRSSPASIPRRPEPLERGPHAGRVQQRLGGRRWHWACAWRPSARRPVARLPGRPATAAWPASSPPSGAPAARVSCR